MIKNLLTMFISLFVLISTTACDVKDTTSDNNITTEVQLGVLHASPDAPKVDVSVNGDIVLSSVDYAKGSGFLNLDSDTYTIAVDGLLPAGEKATVIGPVDLNLEAQTRYVIIAANDVSNIEPLLVSAPIEDVSAFNVRVQIIHATASAPKVDVYVTAPDADINETEPVGTLAYKDTLGPVEVPASTYQIRVTPKNSKDVIFDSGSVALAGGSDLVIAAIANVGNGASPIELAVLDKAGSSIIMDKNTPASFRVIHDSPDAPAVDIVVNDSFDAPLVANLSYPEYTPFVDVPADTYNVKVAVAGTQTAVIDANLTLPANFLGSVYAVNTLANIEPLILVDDKRRVATEAKIRLVHGAPSAPNVDIYVTAPDADIESVEPAFSNVAFKAETGYVSLAEGTYQVRITPTGTKTVVIDTQAITLNAGGIYTAVARDAAEGEESFGLILLDDFNEAGQVEEEKKSRFPLLDYLKKVLF